MFRFDKLEGTSPHFKHLVEQVHARFPELPRATITNWLMFYFKDSKRILENYRTLLMKTRFKVPIDAKLNWKNFGTIALKKKTKDAFRHTQQQAEFEARILWAARRESDI